MDKALELIIEALETHEPVCATPEQARDAHVAFVAAAARSAAARTRASAG